ncbi:MAG: hypothetical protein IKY82_03345 [Alistipes sp.]|nr:hypothetical protein [Alistipes sp.]
MERNDIEFQELNELREQVSLLKEKLLRQQIISEQAIIAATQKGIGTLNRAGKMYVILGLFAAVFSPWSLYNVGFSKSLVISTALFLVVCVCATIYAHWGLMSVDVTRGNLVEIYQRLIHFRKVYGRWQLFSIPTLVVWSYYLYRDAQLMLEDAEFFLVCAAIGAAIGAFFGFKKYFIILREADKAIANVKELMQQE